MKRIITLLLAVCLLFGASLPVFAADRDTLQPLQFRQDGTFRILHFCDIHDDYPTNASSHAFIAESLAALQPGLAVLGGDNCVAAQADTEKCIQEICDLFVQSGVPFTLVFGNHDDEHGIDKEALLAMYQKYGGEYCLAFDADPALTGVGTHDLPIRSADGGNSAFHLYLFDSNTYTYDADGNRLGYDAVHPDQIAWYRKAASAFTEQNGRQTVPALAFQHIIVQEAYDALFYRSPVRSDAMADMLQDVPLNHFDGVWFTYLPKIAALQKGLLLERPCPGYYNYGQLDAMQQIGDVQAVFSGHDHTNTFTLHIKGIDVVNTPSCGFGVTSHNVDRGVRVIDLDEQSGAYQSYVYYAAEHILRTDSRIPKLGGMSKVRAFWNVLANRALTALVKALRLPFFFAK